jgi:hypothetical protein
VTGGDGRAEGARRVHGRAGQRAAGHNVQGDGQADRQRVDRLGGALVDRGAKNDADQKEREHRLDNDADHRADVFAQVRRAAGHAGLTDHRQRDETGN